MWWKKKKHGQQQDQQLHEIPIDLVLTDDLYWIFQFCNPFKPLKVALIEQAIVTWGQVLFTQASADLHPEQRCTLNNCPYAGRSRLHRPCSSTHGCIPSVPTSGTLPASTQRSRQQG